MPRKKHLHLAEVKTLTNVIHDPIKEHISYFDKEQPLTLELGCGKGEYVIALAQKYPNRNFIGIDKKADRLWFGAKNAQAFGLSNVKFMRAAIETLPEYFAPASIAEIWITFPDPFPRRTEAKKRLTAPRFQAYYQTLIAPNGAVQLKTDNADLFLFTKQILATLPVVIKETIEDVHQLFPIPEHLLVQTTFEKRYIALGTPIKYIRWHFI